MASPVKADNLEPTQEVSFASSPLVYKNKVFLIVEPSQQSYYEMFLVWFGVACC